MKRIFILIALALFALQAQAQEQGKLLLGTWRLITMESSENGQSTGALYVNRIFLTFQDNGICINPSKIEREYSFDEQNSLLTIGVRMAKVISLTEEELIWDETSGNTVIRYTLKREKEE